MLAPLRSRGAILRGHQVHRLLRYSTGKTNEPIPANDPNSPKDVQNVSETNATPTSSTGIHDAALQEFPEEAEERRVAQAPNRWTTWSRSQQPRRKAMVGPRFEQTIMEYQPMPLAAIDLIHKQPVRWIKDNMVSCDGGGGPLGHPKIFINVDKPQAKEQHRKYLESLPSTPYPLKPLGDTAEVPESQRITDEALGQR
ncbi:MAG: hypothetical protein M1817_000751 [Caeruleum heppii]|nr:MAG: hypothetical protein M1817_000751 [Caeruleum heppii]